MTADQTAYWGDRSQAARHGRVSIGQGGLRYRWNGYRGVGRGRCGPVRFSWGGAAPRVVFRLHGSSCILPALVPGSADQYSLHICNGFLCFQYFDGSTGPVINASELIINLDEWTHVAISRDDQDIVSFYVNGQLIHNEAATPAVGGNTGFFWIGMDEFDGLIDEVRVWDVDRTLQQIQEDMFPTITGTEANLVGYWPLDEGSGTTTSDFTSNGNDGTLIGGPTWVS